jgi:16S rRNA (guanine527-N7)-methyltransferase
MLASAGEFGPDEFASAIGVSRETLARFKLYASLLNDWSQRHNLVSQASLADLWRRHFFDSAQLTGLMPETATSLVDLGSGAGFPGVVLAEMLRERAGFRTVLYESTGKKADFLRTAAERMKIPGVEVRQGRIESSTPEQFDVVAARACAPLDRLLGYAHRFWGPRSTGLFLKGQNVEGELTEARKSWRMELRRHPSRSDASGVILEIRELHRVARKRNRPSR